MSVCAVVVTCNRKELLAECLDALIGQSHPVARVLVVDNASTDGTSELLAEWTSDRVVHVRLPENLGGAGGFAAGVEAGRAQPCEWLWLMDDDAEPRPDALERMLSAAPARDPRTVALCPQVVYASGGLDANQRGHFRRRLRPLAEAEYVAGHHPVLGFTSFVGSLIRTAAARALAPPRADFFVWGDDVEYSLRLRQLGELRLVPESVMLHKREAHAYMTPRATFWNWILPVEMFPTPLDRFWQNLCGLRNYLWIKRTYEGQRALSAAGTTLQFVVKHLLYDDEALRRIPWILRFARDGRRGRFKNIQPSQWREMVRRGEV